MTDLQFDTEQEYTSQYTVPTQPLFVRWVLATGIVKDEKQAQYVLIGVAIVAILLAVWLYPSRHAPVSPPNAPTAQNPLGL